MWIGLPQFVERYATLWMDVGVSLTLEASEIKQKSMITGHDVHKGKYFL